MAKKTLKYWCDFCNMEVVPDHITVCQICGGKMHEGSNQCASCGKRLAAREAVSVIVEPVNSEIEKISDPTSDEGVWEET